MGDQKHRSRARCGATCRQAHSGVSLWQHYLCWSDVPVPRISVIFSLEELKEIEKDCAIYVGRMERVARHSSISKEEKVREPQPWGFPHTLLSSKGCWVWGTQDGAPLALSVWGCVGGACPGQGLRLSPPGAGWVLALHPHRGQRAQAWISASDRSARPCQPLWEPGLPQFRTSHPPSQFGAVPGGVHLGSEQPQSRPSSPGEGTELGCVC